jgi:predicted alpha/beta superfamily hydrolase
MRLYFVLILIICGCAAHTTRKDGDIVLPYPPANDSFLVRINDLAVNAEAADTIHIVYYVDGSLKSGKQMEELITKHKTGLLKKNYVFVGIAHFGYFRPKRRRDFIAPSVRAGSGYAGVSDDYGQADNFYQFLKKTIMPLAEKQYSGRPVSRSFIGHSLGGLFASYLLVNGDTLFDNLYALSPSLWIDNYHVLQYESQQQVALSQIKKNVWISCGSGETLNHIKTGLERVEDTLDKRKYPGIHYEIRMYKGHSHNSSVAPTLADIFSRLVT